MPIYILEHHVCDVCRLLDGDTQLKNCGFCNMCDSWICPEDQPRWDRRLRAFLKRKLEFNFKGLPDYDQHIEANEEGKVN